MPVPGSDPRYRFLARFGATILSGGIAAIPMALYHYQAELRLIPQEVWFVGYILAHRWTADLPYPSLRRMSRRTGVSAQMLHRYKQSLIEKGYLQTIPRHRPSGGRTSNYYDFSNLFHTLEHFLARDRRDGGWQPSADDSGEETLDAHEDDGFDEEEGAPAGQAVPARHQFRGVPRLPEAPGGDQPALTGGQSREMDGGGLTQALPPLAPNGEGPVRHNAPHDKSPVVQSLQGRTPVQVSRHAASFPGGARSDTAETMGTPKRALRALEPPAPGAPPLAPPLPAPKDPDAISLGSTRAVSHSLGDTSSEGATDQWQRILEQLATEVSAASLGAWLQPIAASQLPDGRLRLLCQSTFHLQHVERRFRAAIERAAGAPVEIALA